ncbi:hypothetical protein QZH46_22260 [Pseudomonas corrugata]
MPGQRLGDADHHHTRQVLGLHLVVHLDDLAVDLIVGAFRLAKMQFAQASAFAVGEGDLRDIEDDPVIAHVLESPFELHRSYPFEVKAAILYNERIGFKSFHLAGQGAWTREAMSDEAMAHTASSLRLICR